VADTPREPTTKAGDELLTDMVQDHEAPSYRMIERVRQGILAIEAEAEGAGFAAALMNVARSEAQDTAASSGLRGHIPNVELIGEYEFDGAYLSCECGWNATGPRGGVQNVDQNAVGEEWIEHVRAALAQPAPEPDRSGWTPGDGPPDDHPSSPTPEPSLRDEQEANSAAWHESIRRAQAAKEADTPEPSLRDALAAALHSTHHALTWVQFMGERSESPDATLDLEWADAIIAALPGLSLSAQPSEPGETDPTCDDRGWDGRYRCMAPVLHDGPHAYVIDPATHPSKEETVVEP
jgi:hypothetical protein